MRWSSSPDIILLFFYPCILVQNEEIKKSTTTQDEFHLLTLSLYFSCLYILTKWRHLVAVCSVYVENKLPGIVCQVDEPLASRRSKNECQRTASISPRSLANNLKLGPHTHQAVSNTHLWCPVAVFCRNVFNFSRDSPDCMLVKSSATTVVCQLSVWSVGLSRLPWLPSECRVTALCRPAARVSVFSRNTGAEHEIH